MKVQTVSFLASLFKPHGPDPAPLYAAIVAIARRPAWYRDGAVPDTLDGRFDMVAAITALALIRLERDGAEGTAAATRLTEAFVADMDAQLREAGIGDVVVGKHVGRMVAALGGRLTAYRAALTGDDATALEAALVRNLYRGETPAAGALAFAAGGLRRVEAGMESRPVAELLAGKIA